MVSLFLCVTCLMYFHTNIEKFDENKSSDVFVATKSNWRSINLIPLKRNVRQRDPRSKIVVIKRSRTGIREKTQEAKE